ncbi:MAG: multicomponent Na+:H+ antiporter subunit B [Arenicella sp.]|jgi:multicomponent Na+:H+ antiporter subunit B
MIIIFGVFVLTLLVITAIAIVRAENLFVAVMLTSIFSLLMATNFFLLDAADVALTEAAIGAGVTTVLFLSALSLTAEREKSQNRAKWLTIGVVSVTAMVLIYATFDKPPLGDPNAPVHQHIAPWFFENTPIYIDIPNVVTAVLSSYRGYDTLGEVFVVFAACIGVLFLLSASKGIKPSVHPANNQGLRHHLIPKVVGRLLIPFIILFGLYVQFHGEYGPGGGFQAGAIIATGFILHALLEGERAALAAIPRSALLGMTVTGAMLYGMVGVACMLLGGNFLDYSVLHSNPVIGQQLGIIAIEAGVGIAVCGALLSIFHAFTARGLS